MIDKVYTDKFTLSLHYSLPIVPAQLHDAGRHAARLAHVRGAAEVHVHLAAGVARLGVEGGELRRALHHLARHLGALGRDRKSTRLNSSHANISYAVYCLQQEIT